MAQFEALAPQVAARLSQDLGITPQQAAGIVGALGYESAGLQAINERQPVVPGSRGGFGWAQWTGPRRQQFEAFAKHFGLDVKDPEANYQFLVHELTNTPEGTVLDSIRGTDDPKAAGRLFTEQFLRPGVPAMAKRDSWVERAAAAIFPSAEAAPMNDKLASDPLWQMLNEQPAAGGGREVSERLAADPVWQMLNQPGGTTQSRAEDGALVLEMGGTTPAPEKNPAIAAIEGLGRATKNFVRGAYQGLTDLPAGVGQESVHTGAKILADLGYDKASLASILGARDAEIARRESEYQTATPGSATAGIGRLTGAVAPMFVAGPAAAAAPLTQGAQLAARVLPNAPRLANLLGASAGSGLQSAAYGSAIPVTEGDYQEGQRRNIRGGALIGAASIPVGAALSAGGGYLGTLAHSVVDPFTQKGQQRIAAGVLARAAEGGAPTANSSQIVSGSIPTLAEATGNPGIATLQRSMRDINPSPFVAREQANASARLNELGRAAGVSSDIAAAEAARDLAAGAKLAGVFKNAGPANAAPVVGVIDSILAGPSGKRTAVTSTLGDIRRKLVDAKGNIEADPNVLYHSVRKEIGDLLDAKMAASKPAGLQAARELLQVRDELDKAITAAAPGFDQYLQAYASASKPIEAMRYLQGLNLTDQNGNITLSKIQGAIRSLEKDIVKPGAKAAKSVDTTQLASLKAIRDDLLRSQNINLGRSLGSNTAQNLVTQNMMEAMLPGRLAALAGKVPAGGVGSAVGSGLGYMLGGPTGAIAGGVAGGAAGKLAGGMLSSQNDAVQASLTHMLLNSNAGLAALQSAPRAAAPFRQITPLQRLLYPSINAGGSASLLRLGGGTNR
ncbi:phage tail tip lysozyme [Pigmentiphaga sp. YJ18]|uniref:phage tail tip lysozyme n=1 Tax=Pigmentiphaga sp. YJ18 TaxID=3134907 RepID=UPI003116BA88